MSIAWNKGAIPNLEEDIAEALKTKDWFLPIVHSAIQLEKYGFVAIRDYLESKEVESKLVDKLLEGIRLGEIADYLLIMHVIDKQDFKVMQKVAEERNKFVHRKGGSEYLAGTRANVEYEPLVKATIRVLKEKLHADRMAVFSP